MAEDKPTELIRNIDVRLSRIEQYLPSLATREDVARALDAAIAPLVTREELRTSVALLATKEELRVAIASLATKEELRVAIAPLATRAELQAAIAPLATREELRVEGEQSRRHAAMLFEDLRDDNRIILEHLLALSARVDSLVGGV